MTHFHELLNEERDGDIVLGELEHSERRLYFGYSKFIKVDELKCVIHRISMGLKTAPGTWSLKGSG